MGGEGLILQDGDFVKAYHANVHHRRSIQFCNRVACLNQNVVNFFAYSECGRYPLSVTYMSRCVKFWCKITHMSDQRYPKQCYKMLRQLDEAGRHTWVSNIKYLLFQYGFGYVWLHGEVGDINQFISVFVQRLKYCSRQKIIGNILSTQRQFHISYTCGL